MILCLGGEIYGAVQISRIQRELDSFHVAPVQEILDFRSGQENILHACVDLRRGDVFHFLLRLIPITRLAFLKFSNQATVQLQRLHIIRLRRPVAIFIHCRLAVLFHALRVIKKGVIIPIRSLAGFDGGFKF